MGDIIFSNVSNDYKWHKHSTSITSTSSTVQIPEDDVKYGIICRGSGDSVNFFQNHF